MKSDRRRFALLIVAASLLGRSPANADTVLAYFDFNDGFDAGSDPVLIDHSSTSGSGTLYQQRADIDGDGQETGLPTTGTPFADVPLGIASAAGAAMFWDDLAKSGDNDAEFFIETSTAGFENIAIRFDIKGDPDPARQIESFDLKFDTAALQAVTDPGDVTGTILDFAGGLSTDLLGNEDVTPNGATFTAVTVDLSGFAGVNDRPTIAFRFDDFDRGDGNGLLFIDNVLVTGTAIAIPEPGFSAIALVGGFGVLHRRRRRNR